MISAPFYPIMFISFKNALIALKDFSSIFYKNKNYYQQVIAHINDLHHCMKEKTDNGKNKKLIPKN